MNLTELNQKFGIAGALVIGLGKGNLPCVNVSTPKATALVYLHGAHLASFSPAGQLELLFMSGSSLFQAGKAIRGGVPICFPWFGPGPDAAHPLTPAHGLARTAEWQLSATRLREDGAVEITLTLPVDEKAAATCPALRAVTHHIVIGDHLEMRLEVENVTTGNVTFEEALHTYLAVADVRRISITGLEGQPFLDQLDQKIKQEADHVVITRETDRLYPDSTTTCVLHDPVLRRTITVEKTGSHSTVVWNPWIAKAKAMADFGDEEWPGMMCIESANAKKNAVVLAPGQRHALGVKISVQHM